MPVISYDFRQTYLEDLQNSSKMLILNPKMLLLFQDRLLFKNFPEKLKTVQSPHFNSCHPVLFQSRFQEHI